VYEVITAVCIGCILGICYGALFPCQQVYICEPR